MFLACFVYRMEAYVSKPIHLKTLDARFSFRFNFTVFHQICKNDWIEICKQHNWPRLNKQIGQDARVLQP